MSNKAPAFQWYPKDILASARVQEMSLAEEGAYRRALDFCWLNNSVPADPRRMARLIGKGATVEIAQIVLEMFIPDPNDESRMIHERLEVEREKQRSNSEARRLASEARWNKQGKPGTGKQATSSADANALQMESIAFATSTTKEEKQETNVSLKKRGCRIPADFYPNGEMIAYAVKEIPDINLEGRILEFKNYWETTPGKAGIKLDWNKTFQNRIIQIVEYQQKGGKGLSKQNGTNKTTTNTDKIRNRDYSKFDGFDPIKAFGT